MAKTANTSNSFPRSMFLQHFFLIILFSLLITLNVTALTITELSGTLDGFTSFELTGFTVNSANLLTLSIDISHPTILTDRISDPSSSMQILQNIALTYHKGGSSNTEIIQAMVFNDIPISKDLDTVLLSITVAYYYPYSGIPFTVNLILLNDNIIKSELTGQSLTNTPGNNGYLRFPVQITPILAPNFAKFNLFIHNIGHLADNSGSYSKIGFTIDSDPIPINNLEYMSIITIDGAQIQVPISDFTIITTVPISITFKKPLPLGAVSLLINLALTTTNSFDFIKISFFPFLIINDGNDGSPGSYITFPSIIYETQTPTTSSSGENLNKIVEIGSTSVSGVTGLSRTQITHSFQLYPFNNLIQSAYTLKLGVPPLWALDFRWYKCRPRDQPSSFSVQTLTDASSTRPSTGFMVSINGISPVPPLTQPTPFYIVCMAEYSSTLSSMIPSLGADGKVAYLSTLTPYISFTFADPASPKYLPIGDQSTSSSTLLPQPSSLPEWKIQPSMYGAMYDSDEKKLYQEWIISVQNYNIESTMNWSIDTPAAYTRDLVSGTISGLFTQGLSILSDTSSISNLKILQPTKEEEEENSYFTLFFDQNISQPIYTTILFNSLFKFKYRMYYSTYPMPFNNYNFELNFGRDNKDITNLPYEVSFDGHHQNLWNTFKSDKINIYPAHVPKITMSVGGASNDGFNLFYAVNLVLKSTPLNFPSSDKLLLLPEVSIWKKYSSVKIFPGTKISLIFTLIPIGNQQGAVRFLGMDSHIIPPKLFSLDALPFSASGLAPNDFSINFAYDYLLAPLQKQLPIDITTDLISSFKLKVTSSPQQWIPANFCIELQTIFIKTDGTTEFKTYLPLQRQYTRYDGSLPSIYISIYPDNTIGPTFYSLALSDRSQDIEKNSKPIFSRNTNFQWDFDNSANFPSDLKLTLKLLRYSDDGDILSKAPVEYTLVSGTQTVPAFPALLFTQLPSSPFNNLRLQAIWEVTTTTPNPNKLEWKSEFFSVLQSCLQHKSTVDGSDPLATYKWTADEYISKCPHADQTCNLDGTCDYSQKCSLCNPDSSVCLPVDGVCNCRGGWSGTLCEIDLNQKPQQILDTSLSIQTIQPYQPLTGTKINVIHPNNSIQIKFKLTRTHTIVDDNPPISKQFQLSLTLPYWISTGTDSNNIHSCTTSDPDLPPYQLTRVPSSTSTADSQIITFHSEDFFNDSTIQYDATFTCTIVISFDTTIITTRSPFDQSALIPITPVTISFIPDKSTQRLSTQVIDIPTAKWLYPIINPACPTETSYYSPCPFDTHPFVPPAVTKPPPPPAKLPTNTASLTDVCELVLTNKNQVEVFQESKHKQICSIPIAGSLITRTVLGTDFPDLIASSSFPQGQTEFTLCDCKCKGYWHDDMLNDDNKKCSKCSVPDCPSLLTPNSDCTACECTTAQCKRFRTYVFSTIYVTPQALRYIAKSSGVSQQLSFDQLPLSATDLSTFVTIPSTDIAKIYLNTMSSFSSTLTSYIKSQISAQLDPKPTSSLESVTITPLIEGSFTVWKVTLSIVNGSQQPLSSLAPLYGLPSIESTIGSLFGTFHTTGLGIAGAVSPPQLELAVTTPTLANSKLKLFTTDVMRTGCLSSVDAKTLGTTLPATAAQLHTCPLPNQYTSVPDNSTKTVLLNPLWSSCPASSSSSSSPSSSTSTTSFINYEDLLSTTEPTTTKLNIREMYPRCLDFTGVDVGLLHYIPCSTLKDKVLYSTTSSTLLLPIYTATLLSSFSTTTLSQLVQDRIQLLKSLQQPRFPQFPQSTIVPCPVITTSTSPKNEITYLPQRCPVGTYGDKCQLTNTIEETSMTASPTTLSAQSHSHIQWEYLGDNTQELTLVLQANKEKTGSGYFVWSQFLGTVPVASLYASAQIPTIDESKLFQYIYDAIASDNTAFTSIYNTQTDIIVRGYFTRAANLTIDLDTTQLPAGSFKFELPMLCNDFDVQCRQPISQFCHQSDGRCRCGPGYYDADPTKERTPDYVVELVDRIDASTGATISEQMNFDGDDLQCLPICKNGGTWVAATQLCTCAPGFSGVNCEVKDECDHSAMCSHGNGYLSFTTTTADDGSSTDECSTDCTCYGQWADSDVLILAPPTPPTTETEPLSQCSICALKPLSSQFYNQTTISQLQTLLDQYENNPSLAIYGTQDEKYTQTYQPAAPITTDTEANPLTQQRCYVTGTDPVTFDKGNCSKCLCRKGYGGDYCQLHVAYASITYTPGINNKYTYDTMTEVLLFDKIAEELSLSMNNFDKNDLFIVEHDTKQHLIRVGFYTGLDFFTRNAQLVEDATAIDNNEVTNPMGMMLSLTNQRNLMSVLQANKYNFDIWNQPPTNYNPQLPTNLDNLYTQWGDLTQTAPTKPITNQDTDSFLGGVNIETGIDDTSCVEQSLLGCFGAETKRASSTALIIGLVVGLVCATLLLLVLILVLRWCKKNNRGFWKSKEDQDRDEMSNFVPTTRKEFTGSTAAPSMTVGTLSIMPAGMNDGVEMTKTGASATSPASSVQSVNNHTEVKDPTLPVQYKAYKDAKGNVFYINSETMTTSWTHPNEVNNNPTASGGDAGYGSDW